MTKPAKKNDLIVCHTIAGQAMVAQEIERKNGIIEVRGLCMLDMQSSMTQLNFTPLRYADPAESYFLNEGALLGTQPLPKMFREPFQEYLEDVVDK